MIKIACAGELAHARNLLSNDHTRGLRVFTCPFQLVLT